MVVVAALMVTGAVIGKHRPSARQSAPASVQHTVVLRPPAPIPGYLLIADRGNNRMLLVDSAKRIYWRYPRADGVAMPFRFDDDTFFGPQHDRVISNQEEQHTIQIVSFPAGRILWRFGHVNVKSGAPGYLNTPDDAYLLPNHLVSVADAYNCRVLFISPAHRVVRMYGTTGVCRHNPPSELGAVNGATPLPNGDTLVSEITGSWIDDISRSGRLRWAVQAPVSYPSDPQLLAPDRILLADYAHPGHALIMSRTGRVLWRYGPSSGAGELDHPSLAMRIAPGLVAINDDYRDRVIIVSIRTHRIVWQYGHTDQAGTGPGYLNTPDGMDLLATADAQRSPVLRHLLGTSPAARPHGSVEVTAPFRLPAPVEREVAAVHGSAILLAGGLDTAQQSTNGVFRFDPSTGRLTALGSMPQPFHDAAGAVLGNSLFVFGGGVGQSSSAVQRFDLRSRSGRVVANLPRPLSDLAAVETQGTVYLVGGWDSRTPRREIYATTDGVHFRVVGRLPQGLRYPAVAAVGSRLVIAGGATAAAASSAVYVFDTKLGRVVATGHLPAPLAHASAVALGGNVYVTGAGVVRVDPASGRVTQAGVSLPASDAGAVVVGGVAFVIGGSTGGHTSSIVRELRVR